MARDLPHHPAVKNKRPRTRTGFTTGACAAAAARAALVGLITGQVPRQIEARLPNDQRVTFAVLKGQVTPGHAHAIVVKDAGDDPDCTNGAHIVADLYLHKVPPHQIRLSGGKGVGKITRPGLGLAVGEAAINPVPRANIEANLREAAGDWLDAQGVEVVISVPGGEKLAKRTLNPRLGIMGGISILGTCGIVYPFSTSSFKATVVQGIQVALAQGEDTVVLTTGRRSEKFAMACYPELAKVCFIQMGDFVGIALEAAKKNGFKRVIVAAMVGKITKMAQGAENTHAHRSTLDTALLAQIAQRIGANEQQVALIDGGISARHALEVLAPAGLEDAFYAELARAGALGLRQHLPTSLALEVRAFDFEGVARGRFISEANEHD